MVRFVVRACAVLAILTASPQLASAQWYASPFVGKLSSITFDQGAATGATALGIAAGTSPRGRLGLELEFMSAADVFTPEELGFEEDDFSEPVLKSRLQTFTVSAHGGHAMNLGRVVLRPYGVVGGGLGMYKRTVVEEDFEAMFNLPFDEQMRIDDCVFAEPFPSTSSGLIGRYAQCGKPTLEEDESAAAAVLDFGGGVTAYLTSHIGVRADFRYVTQIVPSEDKLSFFRSVIAVVIH